MNVRKQLMKIAFAVILVDAAGTCCATAAAAELLTASKAQWYYDEVFDKYSGHAALAKDPQATVKYAAFYAEDAILCEPNGMGLCLHGREAITQNHILPFESVKCHAIRPTTNEDNNSITTEWVCATNWGNGCMSALKGLYYMEFNDNGLITKKIATMHPDDPLPPPCFQPPAGQGDEL